MRVVSGRPYMLDFQLAELDSGEQDTGYDDRVRLLHKPALVVDTIHARKHGDPPVQPCRADLLHLVPPVRADHLFVLLGFHHRLDLAVAEAHHRRGEAAVHTQVLLHQEQGLQQPQQEHLDLPEAASLQPDDEVAQGADRGAEAAAASPDGHAAPGAVQSVHHSRAVLLPLCSLQQRGSHRAVQRGGHREDIDLRRGAVHHRQGCREHVFCRLRILEV
mmetsp:Transcript_56687/g.151816  ORF Transcript_56687/g.151816 Transcript_56687/m.151816 type:complete len:218 (+) Transcript_56687:552-1205(+)